MANSLVMDAAPLPQQLHDLQRRARTVLGHELARHPATATLQSFGRALLANFRRIQEIQQATATRSGPGDTGELTLVNLIRISQRLLDTLQGQMALCESAVRESLLAAEWAGRLVAQEQLPYAHLLPLYSRMVDDVSSAPVLSRLLPLPGLSLVALVESRAGRDAALLIEGLTAARVIGWTLHDDRRAAANLPALVLAAVWQDIGRWPSASARPAGRPLATERTAWIERQHPAIGAGILGAIGGAPVELALMVGQHHERLDGGGYPRSLAARDILPDAAILAAGTRFARLALELDVDPISPVASSGPGRAAQILLAEADAGLWPVEFARLLAARIAESGEDAAPPRCDVPQLLPGTPAPADEPARGITDRRDRHWQLHGQEPALPPWHTGLGRRFSEPGWYEKKMLIDRESR